jgi:3-oxoacyl-[acyl-carrier-protein] synthase-3
MTRVGIRAIGAFVPEKVLDNAALERIVDTTDAWITERTGIKERRVAAADVLSHDLATEAARRCLEGGSTRPDVLISSTATPGRLCPYQACIIANRLKLGPLPAFDINAACTGMIYGLGLAKSLLESSAGAYQNILVTAGEKMTMFADYTDRATCVLFGDGASALLVSSECVEHELLHVELGTDPTGADYVTLGAWNGERLFRQDGRQVYRFAVTIMNKLIDRLMAHCNVKPNDRYWIIPHQANLRIMQAVAESKKIPFDRFITNIEKYGNTSSASIGLALEEAWREGRFEKGDLLFLIGFGGGLSWAGAAIRW